MSKLAINGGSKVREKPFPDWPIFDEQELKLLTEVLNSGKWWRGAYSSVELGGGIVSGRSKVEEFEEKFSAHHKAKYAVATSHGSDALDIAIKALGVGPGDEVIVPPYTFVATATSVLHNNAIPIFVDIHPDTYNLDPNKIEEAITDRTKAIIPVHFGGALADMGRINQIAKKYNIRVIEDAAHAHGVEWENGKMAGTFGDIGMFSFQQSKNMAAGEGGIVITNDEELYSLCFSYHHYGREKGRPWYEIHRLGWNFRMTEFQGAVLIPQLGRLERLNAKRTENAKYLTNKLSQIDGLVPLTVDSRIFKPSYYLYIFKYNKNAFKEIPRDVFIKALNSEGIPITQGYDFPIYKNPLFLTKNFSNNQCPVNCSYFSKDINYSSFEEKCPVSEKACNEEALWLTQNLFIGNKNDINDICDAIWKIIENLDELLKIS
ncbi:DegT/DnrJ/EryC1/StrS family aminotransferase [Atribacter laminatus]|uniref:L-glutamine:2-deoxy-scyllo-inosose aminotransferase n=1 Tax=Atribacter laminatus TaxID=2847778 RepID=A0A7T1ALL5_ATRLM|nr:DegT/DnrJ/EryC1/StrS family aminotransferase [Atribacter laminatus]QPM68158.1 L-glutamine:2-deoxy-scyllo-inosose aminotransferase [Atribacter laminatus]